MTSNKGMQVKINVIPFSVHWINIFKGLAEMQKDKNFYTVWVGL